MSQSKNKFEHFFLQLAIYSTALTCFFIPLSTSLLGIFSGITMLCWLISGRCKNVFSLQKTYPHSAAALLLFALFCLGVVYSPVTLEVALDTLKKYRELLFIPVILSIVYNKPKEATLALNSFAAGMIILLCLSYMISFGFFPSLQSRTGESHIYHITHSFFMAILAFWSIHKFSITSRTTYFWLLIFLLASINLAFITPGRTGMLIYAILTVVYLSQKLSVLKFALAMVITSMVFGAGYRYSDNIHTRLNAAVSEIQHYNPGKEKTSMGMRLDWYQNSIALIEQKPILGHGTGAFSHAQDQLIKNTLTVHTDNPHNEYLFIGTQLGITGLLLFLTMFGMQFYSSFKLSPFNRYMAQGVIVSMMAGCLMNSFLFDSMEGHFYAFTIALLLSPVQHSTRSC